MGGVGGRLMGGWIDRHIKQTLDSGPNSEAHKILSKASPYDIVFSRQGDSGQP